MDPSARSVFVALQMENHGLRENISELKAECESLRAEIGRIHKRLAKCEDGIAWGSDLYVRQSSCYRGLSIKLQKLTSELNDIFTSAGCQLRMCH